MVDQEVEQTLREIRERVRAAATPATAAGEGATVATVAVAGGAGVVPPARAGAPEALARMEANLSTTERAWSRLPPVLSYRRGAVASVELALKRLVKRALHWFTWEQVNFNSAAHHALGDAHAALAAHEGQLAAARADLADLSRRAAEAEARAEAERARAEAERARAAAASERRHAELRDELARARTEHQRAQDELRAEHARAQGELRAEHERARGELSAEVERLRDGLPALGAGLRDGLRAELGGELRERAALINEESRVCFRQLSLAATEAAVAHDRARRLLEARLEAMERAVNREP